MPSKRTQLLLIAALLSASAGAQEDVTEAAPKQSWREGVVARCVEQYSAEQCADAQFLEEHFHINSLEVAHGAAIRRNRLERDALRELTLQRVCDKSPGKLCAGADNPAVCATDIVQSCSSLTKQAALCLQHVERGCTTATAPAACAKQKAAQCPSVKKQPLDVFFAKYPKLAPEQKNRLIAAAKQIDAQQGWFSNLLDWIGF